MTKVQRRQPSPRGGERGFTMIELLMTMVLLTIVMTGLAALQITAVRQVSNSKRGSEAMRLGQQVLERFGALRFNHASLADTAWITPVNANNNSMTSVKVNGRGASDGEQSGPYSVTYMVETVGTGRKVITVKVTWLDTQSGVDPAQRYAVRSVTLATQKAQ